MSINHTTRELSQLLVGVRAGSRSKLSESLDAFTAKPLFSDFDYHFTYCRGVSSETHSILRGMSRSMLPPVTFLIRPTGHWPSST